MRTAINLSLTVPEIGELWNRTADLFSAAILERAGVPAGLGPGAGAGPCALLDDRADLLPRVAGVSGKLHAGRGDL